MISVDTNIIVSALSQHDVNHSSAREQLNHWNSIEVLIVSPIVVAELMASQNWSGIRAFLERADIQTLWETPASVWERAGTSFGEYARSRRQGSLPRRIVADFVIAAHAEHHRLDILSFDSTVYKAVFPHLRLYGSN